MAEQIGSIKRGNGIIRVRVDEYNGKTFADIRNYYLNDDGEYAPTKKGVSFYHVEDIELAIKLLSLASTSLATALAAKGE